MTNGEKIIEVFNPEEVKFREIKGRVPTVLSFVGSGRIEVEQTWWNAEYEEPSDTKTIIISKGAVKHGNKDYVVYKRDWLMEHLDSEFEVLKGAKKLGEKIKNAKPSTWLTDGLTEEEVKETVDNALVEVNNAKWVKAIEKIRAEIEAKNTSIENFADTHGWVNGLTNEHNAHEADLAIITKHTKELMK